MTGSQNERIKVKLDGDKSLALKPVNLTKLDATPPKPKPAAKPPPRAPPASRSRRPQKPQSADAGSRISYKEDKKEAPTSDDAEILAMEANIKEYKAQEKRRAIKAAKARAARQGARHEGKIIEDETKNNSRRPRRSGSTGGALTRSRRHHRLTRMPSMKLHHCKPTKKKSWFNWKPQTDEDVALTADELAYAGDFGTDEEARVQRKLVPKRPGPTDWEELSRKHWRSRTAPSRAKTRKEPSSFCRDGCGGVAMSPRLVELGLPFMNYWRRRF